MYGAIIGDMVGSIYEFHNIKTKEFPFMGDGCEFTDDTVMTVAVARALMRAWKEEKAFEPIVVEEMRELGRRFPDAGYGGRFSRWLRSPYPKPYHSYGNGSAMRASPCGLIAVTLEEAVQLARASARVTHDHPEGIKGAEATAAAVFMAKSAYNKEEIRSHIERNYYTLGRTLDEIRPGYRFDETCQGSVPEAIEAFLESDSYEDCVRNAVSIGGDSDTVAAIAGSIAWSYYRFNGKEQGPCANHEKPGRIWPDACLRIVTEYGVDSRLPKDFVQTIEDFDALRADRCGTYDRTGMCRGIVTE